MQLFAALYLTGAAALGIGGPEVQSAASGRAIHWQRDYASASTEARRTGRPLLVHFTASWCNACLRLERSTFSEPSVIQLMNESTAAVQVDADAAPELLRRFGIGRLPTALLISPSGFVQGRIEGYRRADEYTAELSSLLERMPRPVTLTGSIVEFPVGGGAAERARDLSHDRTLKRSTGSEENRARSSCIILASHLEPSLALGGYCPVTLMEGKTLVIGAPELRVNYDGQSYYFAGSDEQERFRANPSRYVPVMGGLCVVSFVSAGQHVPGDPHCGAIYRGRLYLFTGPEERTRFRADPKAYARTVAEREPATAD